MRRVAVFLPNWIGDVVMATPAVRALRHEVTGSAGSLVAVCKSYVAETLAGSPWFDETIHFDKRNWLSVVRKLRQLRVDTAVLFPNSFRAAAIARLGGCRTLVGFARYGRDMLLTKRLYPARGTDGRPKPVPVIDDYNKIVRLLGLPDAGHRMELFTTPLDEAAADRVWQEHRLHARPRIVGLNPGGAFGSSKHWPTSYFAELARTLVDRDGSAVIVLCGPAERETAREIAKLADRAAVVSLADAALSIGLTKAVVRRLDLLVTTDSGPRHFAAAFDRPVITLFGPTHIGWTETYFEKAVHLQKKVPCGPCQLRTCPLDHRCMTELVPGEVYSASMKLCEREQTTDGRTRLERRHAS